MSSTARITYTGVALPGNGVTVVLFDTTVAFPGASYLAQWGMKRIVVDLAHDQAGTLKAYKSNTRLTAPGATPVWVQIENLAVAAPAANTSDVYDRLIEEFADYKLEWLNGATPQTLWQPDVALSSERVKSS